MVRIISTTLRKLAIIIRKCHALIGSGNFINVCTFWYDGCLECQLKSAMQSYYGVGRQWPNRRCAINTFGVVAFILACSIAANLILSLLSSISSKNSFNGVRYPFALPHFPR